MNTFTKDQERAYYKTFKPESKRSALEKMIIDSSPSSLKIGHAHIKLVINEGGIEMSTIFPAKHIHVINGAKLWLEEEGSHNFSRNGNHLTVNGKTYQLAPSSDEWQEYHSINGVDVKGNVAILLQLVEEQRLSGRKVCTAVLLGVDDYCLNVKRGLCEAGLEVAAYPGETAKVNGRIVAFWKKDDIKMIHSGHHLRCPSADEAKNATPSIVSDGEKNESLAVFRVKSRNQAMAEEFIDFLHKEYGERFLQTQAVNSHDGRIEFTVVILTPIVYEKAKWACTVFAASNDNDKGDGLNS